ncbi:ribosomal-processing cysteine protease Prp [Streptococcus ferus]|uniref:ribosomal-processing cysteine protease Prp n=1 Tax=Streptococcus ferus TaxID=1345 RepID=UPI0035A1D489
MIKAIFTRRQSGQLEGVVLSGHAGSGEFGFDIVCAAVSTLAINLVNALEVLTDCQADIDMDDLDGGYMKLDISSDPYQSDEKVQLLFEAFFLGISNLADNQSRFVDVQIQMTN